MKTKYRIMIALLIFFFIIIIQIVKDINNILTSRNLSLKDWYWGLTYVESNSPNIRDNPLIYTNDEDDIKIKDLYIVVLPKKNKNEEDITFKKMNNIEDFKENILELDIMVLNLDSNSDFDPREYNVTDIFKNGTIKQRGHSTMEAEEKSYKIKIKGEGESFLGYNILNLNKHPYDHFKVRNKIAFELIEKIPNIISIRTNLINLYIKDLSEGKDEGFVDYGLFTHIEQANVQFLKDRKLDSKGYLYKAEYFEFFRYEDEIKSTKDPLYNKEKFEERLEIKVSSSHEKIIKMIEDVNDKKLDINKVLDKHFNRDNYYTWLAINILLGNNDTQTQNFFLYSPRTSLTWYFVPWDYDGSMNHYSTVKYDYEGNMTNLIGVSNYWNSVLHNRVFREPNNLEELNEKIEEVYKILSKKVIEKEVNKYYPIIKKCYEENPNSFDNISEETFDESIEQIINITDKNIKLYYETLEKPMPIYLGEITKDDGGYLFEWDYSFDLQGDEIRYILKISKDPEFKNIIFEKKRLRENHYIVDLEQGEYYWKVIVIDSKGNTQRAFDQLEVDEVHYYGIKKITIE